MQVLSSCLPAGANVLTSNILKCLEDVEMWMSSNRLKLNPTKTEFIWCAKHQQQHLINTAPLIVQGNAINPSQSVRLLGVNIDSDLTMSSAVSRTVSTCFYQLRRIQTMRRSLPIEAAKMLINACVLSRIDYGNG